MRLSLLRKNPGKLHNREIGSVSYLYYCRRKLMSWSIFVEYGLRHDRSIDKGHFKNDKPKLYSSKEWRPEIIWFDIGVNQFVNLETIKGQSGIGIQGQSVWRT